MASLFNNIIEGAVFNSGCRERQHYNYLNFYKRGNCHNCMIVIYFRCSKSFKSIRVQDRVFTLGIRNAKMVRYTQDIFGEQG